MTGVQTCALPIYPTRFGEFIIMSGDADFTPVLHHLRGHDRRTVIYANESTADIYKAFSDGWIEEQDLISFLLEETQPLLPVERAPARAQIGYEGQRLGALNELSSAPLGMPVSQPQPASNFGGYETPAPLPAALPNDAQIGRAHV